MLIPDWALQVGSIILIGGAVILILRLGIVHFKKLGEFLMILDERPGWREGPHWRSRRYVPPPKDDRPTLPDRPDLPKHEPRIMAYSLIKFLLVIFVFTAITHGILVFPMIIIWAVFAVFFAPKYIVLWKAHKYSVALLIGSSLAAIALSILVSPFIRRFAAFIFRGIAF